MQFRLESLRCFSPVRSVIIDSPQPAGVLVKKLPAAEIHLHDCMWIPVSVFSIHTLNSLKHQSNSWIGLFSLLKTSAVRQIGIFTRLSILNT